MFAETFLENAVLASAFLEGAGVTASVAIDRVAIIAFFFGFFDAVATEWEGGDIGGNAAGRGATVVVVAVTIVTLLSGVESAVAALRDEGDIGVAGAGATIVVSGVAVVAELVTIEDAVAAERKSAVGATAIRESVAVSCALITVFADVETEVAADALTEGREGSVTACGIVGGSRTRGAGLGSTRA